MDNIASTALDFAASDISYDVAGNIQDSFGSENKTVISIPKGTEFFVFFNEDVAL